MYNQEKEPSAPSTPSTSNEDFTKTWRYKAGIFLFVGGQVVLVIGLMLPVLGLAPKGHVGIVGILALCGELTTISSIVFLGKDGFLAIKKKLFGAIKKDFEAPVGKARHYLGILLFCLNGIAAYVIVVYAWQAFSLATPEGIAPMVWGMNLEQQSKFVFYVFLTGELGFLASIYMLGADWWGRFRGLFVWNGN